MSRGELTRDGSTIVAVRVTNEQKAELAALCKAAGVLQSRALHNAFEAMLNALRDDVNQRRAAHGLPIWENEWSTQLQEENNGTQP